MDFRLELVLLPVTDVDRAKAFYGERCGFTVDVDHRAGEEFRVVQMTPPGSACSFSFGVGISEGEPGSVKGTHLVVTDIEAAHKELTGRGVEVGGIKHMGPNGWERYVLPRRRSAAALLERAKAEGVLAADADVDVLIDMMAGAVMYRVIRPEPFGPEESRSYLESVYREAGLLPRAISARSDQRGNAGRSGS